MERNSQTEKELEKQAKFNEESQTQDQTRCATVTTLFLLLFCLPFVDFFHFSGRKPLHLHLRSLLLPRAPLLILIVLTLLRMPRLCSRNSSVFARSTELSLPTRRY
jgi:hypothetical protein